MRPLSTAITASLLILLSNTSHADCNAEIGKAFQLFMTSSSDQRSAPEKINTASQYLREAKTKCDNGDEAGALKDVEKAIKSLQ